jgi:hypothetical protein
MQQVIHLRVLIDYEKDVFRDIEIRSDDTFLTLHEMIQQAFGFDNSQMASFYVSNAEWEKGQEITLMEVMQPEEDGEPIWLMQDVELSKIIFEKDQKLIYVFDFMVMWCFYIDAISVHEVEDVVILPRITQEFGTTPDQYSKTGDIVFDGIEVNESEEEDDDENELDEIFRSMEGFDEENY